MVTCSEIREQKFEVIVRFIISGATKMKPYLPPLSLLVAFSPVAVAQRRSAA